jgi:hypothetical protein
VLDERNVFRPEYKAELLALGFEFIPVVVIRGRAFAAFPEDLLRREVGLPPRPSRSGTAHQTIESAVSSLRILLGVVRHIPDEYWGLRLLPDRDRSLGQWVWHIFEIPLEFMNACERRTLRVEDIQRTVERKYWAQEREFLTFEAIAKYGANAVDRVENWASNRLDHVIDGTIDSIWGSITTVDLLDQLDRHSAVHLRQVVDKLTELMGVNFVGRPAPEVLARVPQFVSLKAD